MRAFRLLTALFSILAAVAALGQTPPSHTIPIHGNLSTAAGSPQPYAGLSLQLQNCPSPVSIPGYSVIVQQTIQLRADASGIINANIVPNDLITCNGTTGQSVYAAVSIVNGVPSGTPQCYQVTSTQGIWNLNTQQPIACTQTPPNPQDATYNNLNVNGCLSIQGGACVSGGSGAGGVTKIIAGTNVTIAPTGGTGDVTINAAGGGGSTTYPPSGIPQSTGSAWGVSKQIQGSDTLLLSAGAITLGAGNPLCLDAVGGATTTGCVSAGGLPPAPSYPGFVYEISPTLTRKATFEDAISTALLGYAPLRPDANLSDLTNKVQSLQTLFQAAGMSSAEIMGTDSSGIPVPVMIGNGLIYVPATGTGSVVSLHIVSGGSYSSGCPGISFSGGGGSGASGYVICAGLPGNFHIQSSVLTNGGAGYTTAPTVTVSSGTGALTAGIGNNASLATSWQTGSFFSVAGSALPTCGASVLLARLAVSDATSATPGAPYAGGGPYTIAVECILNASTAAYTWVID